MLLLASSAAPWESVAFLRETTALSLSESYASCDTTMSLSMDVYPRLDELYNIEVGRGSSDSRPMKRISWR